MDKIKLRIQELFKGESSGHDYFHTLRVYNNACKIAQKEECNILLVQLAALLHDVDDIKIFNTKNYNNAKTILQEFKYNEQIINSVIKIISEISFKGKSTEPTTIEGKIVQDADRLDAIGAIGIARAFTYGGNKNRELYNPDIKPRLNMTEEEYRSNNGTTINHFYEKLLLLEKYMNTDTAKVIAKERTEFMNNFLKQFYKEWNN
jgi:uncharacterized protein